MSNSAGQSVRTIPTQFFVDHCGQRFPLVHNCHAPAAVAEFTCWCHRTWRRNAHYPGGWDRA